MNHLPPAANDFETEFEASSGNNKLLINSFNKQKAVIKYITR